MLVVGGGVTGAGVALDAASRGLSTALVEARDFAAGTSSRSSKLIHGGLRYLEQLDFKLVREALKERGLLLQKLAPHLVRPVKFLVPLTHRVWERGYIGAGVTLYDTLGGARALPRHRHLSKRGAAKVAPAPGRRRADRRDPVLRRPGRRRPPHDDDRADGRRAGRFGADAGSRDVAAARRRAGGRREGRRPRERRRVRGPRAQTVVAATGVWSDDMAEAAGIPAPFTVRASKGIHLVVPREKIDLDTGLILRTEKSVLFVIPWGRHWIVGTTDTEWDLDREHPAASRADVDYVLEHLNAVLRTPVTHDDIEGVYAGLRPLLAAKAAATTKLSREHAVAHPVPGLVIVAGGKYTTYRVMAADAVDVVVEELGRPAPPSWTDRLPIVGAEGYHELWEDRVGLAARAGLPLTRVEHLLQRYGTRIWNLLDLIEEQPSLAEPITETSEYLRVEAVYAATHEGALHLEDVLTRRTRISIEERDRGVAAAPVVAGLLAPVLGWDTHRVEREVANYLARVDAERSAQEAPDDAAANATRLTAPALLPG